MNRPLTAQLGAAAAKLGILQVGHTRGILICARQWGKCTVMAIRVSPACCVAESRILVVSSTERQSD